ncbi:type VI secretion system contractile sheath domain-containing protein [Cystobacter fuscus]|uniref:type VI secretion system contractile sheath domain-containing protein n=1 Tax=Cystobacter fuscus TaxID=43 RepID=UPI001E5A7D7E|nr:type VI secretion system contractile sheath large subunit [Cystobacter fuscus]
MSGNRVRWLVAGAFHPSPTGRRFPLTEQSFAEELRRATTGLRVTVPDRIGSGDTSTHALSFGSLDAFGMSALIASLPELRALSALREAISSTRPLAPQDAAHLRDMLGQGRLTEALARARSSRSASLALVEEALFTTVRELLQHPLVARLESAWRGLHWLWTQCPASAGMDLEVLDVGPEALVDTLAASLEGPALQRPDACFLLDVGEDPAIPGRLAALGEQAWLPLVMAAPASLGGAGLAGAQDVRPPDAWNHLRADESSRWLCATLNPVVMRAERHGEVHDECLASPVLGVAALLAASFRDTHTFARLVGPGSAVRAPAAWQPQEGRGPVATEACLSLREQQRLASRGLAGVSGWWDSRDVNLAAAPTVYGGRDAAPLPAQLLTGRIVRLAQEVAERLPPRPLPRPSRRCAPAPRARSFPRARAAAAS